MHSSFHKDPRGSLISVFTHQVTRAACTCEPSGTWLCVLACHYCDGLWLSHCLCKANTCTISYVQHWNVWGRFWIGFQLYSAIRDASACQQKIASMLTKLLDTALPGMFQATGWGRLKLSPQQWNLELLPDRYAQRSQGGCNDAPITSQEEFKM